MKTGLIQQNPTVGALSKNRDRILEAYGVARANGAAFAVTSELALLGYPPRDLLCRPSFVRDSLAMTDALCKQTGEVPLVFGSIGHHNGQLTNDAVVAVGGQHKAQASKQLLPNYDVFDERRYFRTGKELTFVELAGQRAALSICEDAWATAPDSDKRYSLDPLAVLSEQPAPLLVNLSASPFTTHKHSLRPALFADIAKRYKTTVVMANQVGGNDELIFDGRSSVWNPAGELLAQAALFEEHVLIAALNKKSSVSQATEEPEALIYQALVLGIRDYARKCGFTRAVVGLSGGIDSALVAVLAADALGAQNVIGVAMPTRYSSEGSVTDARALANNLGLHFVLQPIDDVFAAYETNLAHALDQLAAPGPGDVTWENVQARIRGATLMAVSNRTGALPITTGNKSEVAVGYCTLYGDMVGGLSAISDVPKTMVYRVARWINREQERIPTSSIEKAPSAELRPDQKDEDSLPPYEVLDPLLEAHVEEQMSSQELINAGHNAQLVERVVGLVRRSEYKRRQAAPGLIVTRKAFGPGRRMPVAARWTDG